MLPLLEALRLGLRLLVAGRVVAQAGRGLPALQLVAFAGAVVGT